MAPPSTSSARSMSRPRLSSSRRMPRCRTATGAAADVRRSRPCPGSRSVGARPVDFAGNGPFPAGSGEGSWSPERAATGGAGWSCGERSGGDLASGDPPDADQEREQHPDGERGAGVRPLGGAHDLRGHLAEGARVVHPRGDAGERGHETSTAIHAVGSAKRRTMAGAALSRIAPNATPTTIPVVR